MNSELHVRGKEAAQGKVALLTSCGCQMQSPITLCKLKELLGYMNLEIPPLANRAD